MSLASSLHADLLALCRIPSPSGQEGAVAAYIRQAVAALGLRVEEDDAGPALGSDTGNLLVQTPGVGEPLFLAAHMDTVPPTLDEDGQVPIVVDGDRVHTGGHSILGGDDKAGIAVALEALRQAVRAPEQTRPLAVIFTVQEEQGGRGAGHFDPARIEARVGFNLDGDTPVGVAIARAPDKARYYVEVHGRAAHAALNPEDGINAVRAAGAIAAALPTGKLDEHTIANLGRIEGGGPINVVPDHARLIGEARSLDPDGLAAVRARFEATAREVGTAHGCAVDFDWVPLYPGYSVPPEAASARLFAAACAAEGIEAQFVSTYGGGDANQFNAKGMACVVFGLGMERIHSSQETILLSDLDRAAAILRRAISCPPEALRS